MKAVRIRSFGGPDKIKIEEIAPPQPGPEDALVRIKAAAVNPVDWMVREKIYIPEGMEKLPLTLGQDFAGVIEKIPQGAKTDFREGDEVFGETWGSFAELAVVPLKDLVRKPKGLSFDVAASLPMAGLTAWQVVIDTAKARPGMKFLIHGAGGPVGSFAAQFAKWKGAKVYVTGSRPSLDFLMSLGVDQIIDYQNERFETKVEDVDVVIEHLGGETQARSWQVLKKGGMLINLIGDIDEKAAHAAGVRAVEFGMTYDVGELKQIAELVEKGTIKPHISKVLPLDEVRKALELNQHGQSHGKIVLKVA